MPNLEGRERIEARLAEALARIGGEAARDVTRALGDPPQMENLTRELWDDLARRYNGAVLPVLEETFTAAIEQVMSESGFAVDWTLVNERAAAWARDYTYGLVRGLNENSLRLVQGGVDDFYRQGLTLRDLRGRLDRAFGPVRAEMIAITETTRAASQGESLWNDELRRMGVLTELVGQTAQDERVCAVCGPRHDVVITDGYLPPWHTRCRCWVVTRIVEVARA